VITTRAISVRKEGTIYGVDVAMASSCGDHTVEQPRSGDLVHARRNTKYDPLASLESQRTETIKKPHLPGRSGSDQNSGAAFLTIVR